MEKQTNGIERYDLCYGSGIVDTYRYTSSAASAKMLYYAKNFFLHGDRYRIDRALPRIIQEAYHSGLRMYDTSSAYGGSEYAIGNALKGKERSSFFIITKLSNADQYKGNIRKAVEKSLSELRMDYIDLYLMHWPVSECYLSSWKLMEELCEEGICKLIGVCNFNIHHLEELKKKARIMPAVNQFECHPLFTQKELRSYCRANGIQVMAYTSTARNDDRLKKTILADIAQRKQKSITQIILRWHQQIGNIPIVNTYNRAHLLEDIAIRDFSLTPEELTDIESININSRLRFDPDNCDFRKL